MSRRTGDGLDSDEACAAAIGRCGEIDRDLKRIEADKETAVAAAAAEAEERAAPLQEERVELARRIEAYCALNRDRLTDGRRRKTAPFPTGEAVWRKGRDTVDVDAGREEKIIASLKKMGEGFLRFIRVKESVSKTAIAGATDQEKSRLKRIAGIAFVPGAENFEVKPVELPLAERPREAA